MKTLIASALIATAALAGAANASLSAEVKSYAPNADVSALSAADANKVVTIVHSGSTESEKRNAIRKIVN